jgi:putative flippase GtrA
VIESSALRQFGRYASVGVTSNLALYLAYLGLTMAGIGHKLAMTFLYVTGVLVTYFANRNWSFGHKGMVHQSFSRYLVTYLLGYLLNLSLLWFGVDHLDLPHQGVQAVAIVIVAVSLFIMNKYWVFAVSTARNPTI